MFPNFHGIDTETFGNVADDEDAKSSGNVVDKLPQLASERNQSQNYRRVGNEDPHQVKRIVTLLLSLYILLCMSGITSFTWPWWYKAALLNRRELETFFTGT